MAPSLRYALVVVTCFTIATPALAGPLATDPMALAGFRGTVNFNAVNALMVDVDYAVFAPGQYPNNGVAGLDPSNGTEYVYAYQAYNLAASTHVLFAFSVEHLLGGGAHNAGPDPLHVTTGGMAPVVSNVNATSVVYAFLPQVPAGGFSQVLLFTSPRPPTFGKSSVLNGGLSSVREAPTPIPEPAALGLFAFGAVLLGRRRNVRL